MAIRLALVLAAVLAGTMRLEAQVGLPPQAFEAAGGSLTATMISADATAFIVRADNGAIVTFYVDNASSIPAGLVPGSRVTVRYDALGGNRYRVASVGIPRIPFDPGSTTEPPPQPPEATLPIATAPREAPVQPSATPAEEDLSEASGRSASGLRRGAEARTSSTPTSRADRLPAGRPSYGQTAVAPNRPGEASADERSREPRSGGQGTTLVIVAGLVLLASSLGLLAILRR